jgi:phosphoglucomutase
VLYYAIADGSWACVRPSGTEPKIKLYFGVRLPGSASVEDGDARLAELADDLKKIAIIK